ncbi:hypothetical protein WJX82_011292 [Trebouxia sp. C0006]
MAAKTARLAQRSALTALISLCCCRVRYMPGLVTHYFGEHASGEEDPYCVNAFQHHVQLTSNSSYQHFQAVVNRLAHA